MGVLNWISTKVDASTVNACKMDLHRVSSICERSREYHEEFSSLFADAVEDFDIRRVVRSVGTSLSYEEVKTAAISIKQKAAAISFGNKVIEEALSMIGNWMMLAALSHHSDPKIAFEAHNLEKEYEAFGSRYSPNLLPRAAVNTDNNNEAEELGGLMATTVGIILNSMSAPPMRRNATALEALLAFAQSAKKFTGREFLVAGSCVDYIITMNVKGNDSNALLALDQFAIKLKHADPVAEAPRIFLEAFTKPFKPAWA